jgi:hypothetical protein
MRDVLIERSDLPGHYACGFANREPSYRLVPFVKFSASFRYSQSEPSDISGIYYLGFIKDSSKGTAVEDIDKKAYERVAYTERVK